jgi:hypothetical protein
VIIVLFVVILEENGVIYSGFVVIAIDFGVIKRRGRLIISFLDCMTTEDEGISKTLSVNNGSLNI